MDSLLDLLSLFFFFLDFSCRYVKKFMQTQGDWEKMESWNLHSFIDVTVPIYTDPHRAIARLSRGRIDQRGGYERHDGYVQDQ